MKRIECFVATAIYMRAQTTEYTERMNHLATNEITE